jgi:hypothetical protein
MSNQKSIFLFKLILVLIFFLADVKQKEKDEELKRKDEELKRKDEEIKRVMVENLNLRKYIDNKNKFDIFINFSEGLLFFFFLFFCCD